MEASIAACMSEHAVCRKPIVSIADKAQPSLGPFLIQVVQQL
mgnify:CR=1 FL=1|jgi:hypothetical protein